MVSPSISRTLRWLAGMQDDDQAEPPQWSGPGYNDPTAGGTISQPLPEPALAAPGPSTTGIMDTLGSAAETIGTVGAAVGRGIGAIPEGLRSAGEAIDPYLAGPARTAPTWEDPLAPVREVASAVTDPSSRYFAPAVAPRAYLETSNAFSEPIAEAATEGMSETPFARGTIPEAVPFVGGTEVAVSPRDVGQYAVQGALDPLSYAGVPGAARAGHLGRGLLEAVPLVGEGLGVAQLGAAAGRRLGAAGRGIGEAIAGNAERVAAADARMAAEGSTMAPGTLGALPEEYGQPYPPIRGDVRGVVREQLGEPSAEMLADSRYPRDVVHPDLRAAGIGPEITPQVDLSSRLNAGFGTVPEGSADRLRTRYAYRDPSDPKQGLVRIGEERVVGAVVDAEREARIRNADHLGALRERQVIEARLARAPDDPELQRNLMAAIRREEEAKDVLDAAREWVQMVKTGDRTLATAGTLPGAASPDRLASVNRVLGQGLASSVSGGVGAQVNQELNPDDPYAGLKGFAAGALVPPLAARGGAALARRAGRATELGSAARIGLGDVPPSRLREPLLPGMEPAAPAPIGEAAEAMLGPAAAEAPPPSIAGQLPGMPPPKGPSFWEWFKKLGYTGMLGPTTAASQTVGGAVQTGLAVEKAIARAVAEGRPGSAGRIVGASVRAVPEGFRSLFEVMSGGQAPASISAAWGGGTARMADRVTNPIGKAAARALDYSTNLWTQAPDAFFSPMFRAIGEREAAEQIAQRTGASADQLMAEAAAARQAGTRAATSEAQDVMDAGNKLSDDLGFRGDPGAVGKKLAALAARDDAVGFLANFLLPFPAMTARSLKATGRLVPGVGEVIGRREGRDTFERLHDQMVGSMGLAAMGYYATQGGITGSGPADKGVRDRLIAEGWQPHSMLIPGVGYLPTRYFQQWAPILDAVGEVHDAYAYGKQGVDRGAVLGDAAGRIGRLATDQVGLGQLNDLLQVLDGSQSGSQVAGLAARSLGRYIPFGATLRQAASVMDPTARKPEGRRPDELVPATSFIQNLEQSLPWFRGFVPERQDVLGRPLPNPQRGLQPALRAQPMLRAFERAGVGVGDPPETIKDPNTGKDRTLTAAQQARWRTAYGRALRSGWADNGSPTDKETLGSVRSKARDEADALVLGR